VNDGEVTIEDEREQPRLIDRGGENLGIREGSQHRAPSSLPIVSRHGIDGSLLIWCFDEAVGSREAYAPFRATNHVGVIPRERANRVPNPIPWKVAWASGYQPGIRARIAAGRRPTAGRPPQRHLHLVRRRSG